MVSSPDNEVPCGTMPEPACQPRHDEIDMGPDFSFPVSSERDIQVIADEPAQGDMPLAPELGWVSGQVRAVEVDGEVEIHDTGCPDGNIRVSREIAEDLERERDGSNSKRNTLVVGRVAVDLIDEHGNSVHIGDFRAQMRRTLRNITGLLAAEGATWHDIVRTTCYLRDIERDYAAFNEERTAFFKEQGLDPLPASTGIQAILCRPELLIEIEAIAMFTR